MHGFDKRTGAKMKTVVITGSRAAMLQMEKQSNTKNNAHIEWLTSGKVFGRFLTAPFSKRKKHFE